MNGLIDAFYYFIIGAALLLSVMGLWFTALIPGIDRWSKRFFLIHFIVLLLAGISALVGMVLFYFPVSSAVIYFPLILEVLLMSLPLPMQTAFLLHHAGEGLRTSKLLYTVLILWVVSLCLLVNVPFIKGFFYVTPEKQYYRGPLYPLILIPLIMALLLNFIHTMKCRSRLPRKAFLSLIIAQVPTAATLIMNLFVDAVPVFDISYVLSALAMYSFILSDQIEQDRRRQQEIVRQQQEIARQQQEIAHERISVIVLQMRPHFIYNTLMSIYSLCRTEPGKARQITLDFTNYLRRNFNAVASDAAIPFSTELEHTRAYLAVEQAQYDDMLIVKYDTPYTRFRLPPLTLQPIVENAVKHGMDLDGDPLHISIRTQRTDSGAEIVVENNGAEYKASDDNGSHIALKNIRERLEMMCKGTISIMPRDGGGTMVKLMIP